MRHHFSRRTRLTMLITDAKKLPREQLVSAAKSVVLSPLARIAALRELVARAPLSVTLGQPYPYRKRAVRRLHGI